MELIQLTSDLIFDEHTNDVQYYYYFRAMSWIFLTDFTRACKSLFGSERDMIMHAAELGAE